METHTSLNSSPHRRRRIAGWAVFPIIAAVLVGWLESGSWLVVYNDGPESLAEIQVQSGADQWTLRDLEPRESRRVRISRREPTELVVAVGSGTPAWSYRQLCDWRETSIITLRLVAPHLVVATSEESFWHRWLRW